MTDTQLVGVLASTLIAIGVGLRILFGYFDKRTDRADVITNRLIDFQERLITSYQTQMAALAASLDVHTTKSQENYRLQQELKEQNNVLFLELRELHVEIRQVLGLKGAPTDTLRDAVDKGKEG